MNSKVYWIRVVFFVLLCFCFVSQSSVFSADTCPFPSCDGVKCYSDIEQNDCEKLQPTGDDYYYRLQPEASVCGCCPGCVEFSKEKKGCDGDIKCGPGLKCVEKNKAKTCEVDYDSCLYYEFSNSSNPPLWVPSCNLDGTFNQKQCKGEQLTGRCFCYSSDGQRIFGQQWTIRAENMTCACSRHVSDLEKAGRTDVTLHCDQEGNYERLQCDSGLCWCAETKTGEPYTQMLPEAMMKILPCYNEAEIGVQYFRQCDSVLAAIEKLRKEMRAHGTETDSMSGPFCDMDGSYGSYQISGTQVYCKTRNGTNLSGMGSLSDMAIMNCNCARDQVYFPESGMGELTLMCSVNGNYESLQYDTQRRGYCVDSDGFAINQPSNEITKCS